MLDAHGHILPFDPQDSYLDIDDSHILGQEFAAAEKAYRIVENGEGAVMAKARACTILTRDTWQVDYTDADETIAGFTPDELLASVPDGYGFLMQVTGPITLTSASESVNDDDEMFWDYNDNVCTKTAGSYTIHIGHKSGATTSSTAQKVELDLTPEWYNDVD